jgi:hypothetical protein
MDDRAPPLCRFRELGPPALNMLLAELDPRRGNYQMLMRDMPGEVLARTGP